MKPRFLLLLTTLVAVLCSGCTTLAPRTGELKQVHAVYRADFAALMLPGPQPEGTKPGSGTNVAFARTLRAIRDYRVAFPHASVQLAHLTVLEGMVYLQSGRVGMARLVAPDVNGAKASLSSATGALVRDGLFAENFDALVKGWGEIADSADKLPNGGDNDATFPESAKFLEAADAITARLTSLADQGRLASPEADEGAVYLATTAAVFYDWAYELRKGTDAVAAGEIKRQKFPAIRKLIGRFLSDGEKTAAADLQAGESVPTGRLRYLQWYQWLGATP